MRTYKREQAPTGAQFDCSVCKAENALLLLPSRLRKNAYAQASCPHCKWQALYWVGKDWQPILSSIGKRFAHNGTTWHATYRPDLDQTKFVTVIYQKRGPDQPLTPRTEHILPGLVTHERFINLLSFT